MFTLQVESDFAAAHQLREYKGKCENLHGHNWRVLLQVSGEKLDSSGMLMDFGDLKKILRDILLRLDHFFLNETPPFDKLNPTSENISKYIYEECAKLLPSGVKVSKATVWESEKCSSSYFL